MPIVKTSKYDGGIGDFQNHTVLMSELSGGFDSGEQTTALIKKIANEFKSNPIIRNLSVRVVGHLDSKDYLGEIVTLFEWVRDNIRYVRDIESCETLQIPTVTIPEKYGPLGVGGGDCDDHALLLATMLKSVGVRDIWARIVTFSPSEKEWKHIYLVVKHKDKIYPLDAIMKEKPFGWECKYFSKKDIKL